MPASSAASVAAASWGLRPVIGQPLGMTQRWVPREVISRIQTCPARMRNGSAAYWMPTILPWFMRNNASWEQRRADKVEPGGHQAGHRHGDDPGYHDAARHAPSHGRGAPGGADADDGAGDGVGGGDRH